MTDRTEDIHHTDKPQHVNLSGTVLIPNVPFYCSNDSEDIRKQSCLSFVFRYVMSIAGSRTVAWLVFKSCFFFNSSTIVLLLFSFLLLGVDITTVYFFDFAQSGSLVSIVFSAVFHSHNTCTHKCAETRHTHTLSHRCLLTSACGRCWLPRAY